MILEMFGYRMAKFYLTMDQEIQVCFMINLKILTELLMDKGCIMEKEIPLIFLRLFLGSCGFVFNRGIGEFVFHFHTLVFQYFIRRESTFFSST